MSNTATTMITAYETASLWRPDARDALTTNDLKQIMALSDGIGIAVFNDVGNERVVRFDVHTGAVTPFTEDEAPILPPTLRGPQSPCGRHRIDVRDHNLWLISTADSAEKQLTFDGVEGNSYGGPRQGGPFGIVALWSSDGRYMATQKMDMQGVRSIVVTEASPLGGGDPKAHTIPAAYPGDEHVPMATVVIIDTKSGTAMYPNLAPIPCTHTSPLMRRDAWWNDTSDTFYLVLSSRNWWELSLVAVHADTGVTETLIHDRAEKRIRPNLEFHQAPCVAVHDQHGDVLEALWFSEQDGWGHLYLHDFTGDAVPRLITDGAFAVASIQRIDWSQRQLWANIAGLVADDPYRETMCRFDLDTGAMTRLFEDELDHRTTFTPVGMDLAWFVDAASTVSTPPRFTIRDWNGCIQVDLGRTDITALEATGWKAPERFAAMADDGVTTVYGTLYYPPHFDPTQKYPVIDHLYPGPQTHRAFPWFQADEVEPYAALGIVGVTIDGRGTPGRDRAFYDHSYRNLGAGSGLADHVSAIKQLAQRHCWLDANSVSTYGHSAGGYACARAMELFPEFYKVGIAASGRHEGRLVMAMIHEAYDDPDNAEVWKRSSAVEAGGAITGKFLIVHGEMDLGCTIFHAYRLMDRMIAANRDFDLLVIPGDDHSFTRHGKYVERRIWDYLSTHLLGQAPPRGFSIP